MINIRGMGRAIRFQRAPCLLNFKIIVNCRHSIVNGILRILAEHLYCFGVIPG